MMKDIVKFEDFLKIELLVGTIISVKMNEKARKPAYVLTVDFGPELGKKQSSAQITNYSRGELLGKSVVAAINLGEKTLPTGFISEFLILGALKPDGTVSLIEVKEKLLPGSVIS